MSDENNLIALFVFIVGCVVIMQNCAKGDKTETRVNYGSFWNSSGTIE